MKIYNEDFYNLFNEIGDLMAILDENSFKIRAYREAARHLQAEIHPITKKEASEATFKKLPGIGDAIAEKMMQYIETGKIEYLEKLRKEVPKAVRDMLSIPHLGPNRVRDLYIKLGIKSKKDLIQAASGENKISFVIFPDNLQVDIRFLPKESYGAALLYFTGSKDFNVMMRKKAIEMGYLLNEYALFKDGEYYKGESEEGIFEALGMKYVEPEKRK